jgi:hypothetical protein
VASWQQAPIAPAHAKARPYYESPVQVGTILLSAPPVNQQTAFISADRSSFPKQDPVTDGCVHLAPPLFGCLAIVRRENPKLCTCGKARGIQTSTAPPRPTASAALLLPCFARREGTREASRPQKPRATHRTRRPSLSSRAAQPISVGRRGL